MVDPRELRARPGAGSARRSNVLRPGTEPLPPPGLDARVSGPRVRRDSTQDLVVVHRGSSRPPSTRPRDAIVALRRAPYVWSRVHVWRGDSTVRYETSRRWPAPAGAPDPSGRLVPAAMPPQPG